MSTLKQLRLRISGVKSTQKITRAMKMVAASKLLKAQDQKDLAKPYANKMYDVVSKLADSVSPESDLSPLLKGTGKNDVHLLVIISSDRGLCGGFNTSIVKKTKRHIEYLKSEGKQYKILCIGKRAYDQLKSTYSENIIEVIAGFSNEKISYVEAGEISQKIKNLFDNKEFDVCTFIYSEFKNAMKQNVRSRKLIPLNETLHVQLVRDYEDEDEESQQTKPIPEIVAEDNRLYEYEPSEEAILNHILPLNLSVQIYYILLENIASEHGARMTAMDAATTNANDMIAKLTLLYNRSRQAAITRELIEIVSSAEAL